MGPAAELAKAPANREHAAGGEKQASIYHYEMRTLYGAPRQLLWPTVTLGLMTLALFAWTIVQMWGRWRNTHGYYSHGPLIVPIAVVTGWLIVRKRGLPMHSTRGARRAGMVLLAGALALHLASMYPRVTFLSGLMIPAVLAAFVLYLGGWPMLRRLWFPIVFLLFMVPLPDVTINDINFHLKMFAAASATALAGGLGVPAYLRGSDICMANGVHLTVEDACSGLRSLISLLAFATLFTYVCKLRGYKRLVLLLAALPTAVAANIVRIVVLTVVANSYGTKIATPGGWVHDTMGFVVFVIAFCMLFLLEELLDVLPGAKSGQWLAAHAWRGGGGGRREERGGAGSEGVGGTGAASPAGDGVPGG